MDIYVANWGNDINSGDSWAHAKKTLQGAVDVGGDIIAKGFFNENVIAEVHGDPFVVVDGWDGVKRTGNIKVDNGKAKNVDLVGMETNIGNSIFFNINTIYTAVYRGQTNILGVNINEFKVKNSWIIEELTLVNSNYIWSLRIRTIAKNCIFSNCEINNKIFNYSLFISCTFKFTGGDQGTDETSFTAPIGTTDEEKMQDLRERVATVYGGNPEDYFQGCQYYSGAASDIFNDPANDDYILVPGCIATYMSYMGSYVGKYPPSIYWNFPNDYTVTANSFTDQKMDDQTVNAVMEGAIKSLPTEASREILTLPILDEPAYRNGVNMNTEDIVAGSTIAAGDNGIQLNHVYRVEDGIITYDFFPDDPDTTVNFSGGSFFHGVEDSNGNTVTDFTTDDGAVVREIFFGNFDRKVKWKFSQSDDTLGNAVEITLLANQKPMVNVDSNNEPTHGNGDDNFVEADAVPLVTQHMKPIIYYQAGQIMVY